jgi:DNA replication protein DnaC
MRTDTRTASSPNSSTEIESLVKTLGDPNCPHCGGAGYVRMDLPLGHEKFGKLESCVCRAKDVVQSARTRLFAMSNLDGLRHLKFENFNTTGNKKAEFITEQEVKNLHDALEICINYTQSKKGWLLLEGKFGAGKTHLAAAIANDAVDKGIPTLFITVPDLLDSLRFAFDSKETTFEERFEEIRNASLLVLDDFGTHNATPWAQEKLFQILNYRYVNKLSTVVTTNLSLDDIEGRVRSRLQDEEFVQHVRFITPDHRRPKDTSNPGISMLRTPRISEMTFGNFDFREDEIGK